MRSAIRAILEQIGPKIVLGVGVSLPGSVERATGRLIAAVNLNWYNVETNRLLRGRLPLPFYYENNANLSALAERWINEPGQAPLHDFVFVMPVGGLGTGIIVNGRLLEGASAVGGEYGHTMLYPDGRQCACGNKGCWEQYASDTALCRLYAEQAGLLPNAEAAPDASAIVRMAHQGDAIALSALKKTASDLGLGFVNVISVFDPEALILGGFLAEAWDLVQDTIWNVVGSRIPRYASGRLRIFPSSHHTDSSLLGAASLVFSHFFTQFEAKHEGGRLRSVSMHAVG